MQLLKAEITLIGYQQVLQLFEKGNIWRSFDYIHGTMAVAISRSEGLPADLNLSEKRPPTYPSSALKAGLDPAIQAGYCCQH